MAQGTSLEASLPPLYSVGPTLRWPQYSPPVTQGIPSRRRCQSQCRGTSPGSPRWKAWVPGGSQTPQSPPGRHLEWAGSRSAGRPHPGAAGQRGPREPLLGASRARLRADAEAAECAEAPPDRCVCGLGCGRRALTGLARGRHVSPRTLLPGAGVGPTSSPQHTGNEAQGGGTPAQGGTRCPCGEGEWEGQRRLGGEDWAFLVLTRFSFMESQMANTTNDFLFFWWWELAY